MGSDSQTHTTACHWTNWFNQICSIKSFSSSPLIGDKRIWKWQGFNNGPPPRQAVMESTKPCCFSMWQQFHTFILLAYCRGSWMLLTHYAKKTTHFEWETSDSIISYGESVTYIDGCRAVYHICLSFRGPQMNRCRLIDEVSVYLQNRSNYTQTILFYSKC